MKKNALYCLMLVVLLMIGGIIEGNSQVYKIDYKEINETRIFTKNTFLSIDFQRSIFTIQEEEKTFRFKIISLTQDKTDGLFVMEMEDFYLFFYGDMKVFLLMSKRSKLQVGYCRL